MQRRKRCHPQLPTWLLRKSLAQQKKGEKSRQVFCAIYEPNSASNFSGNDGDKRTVCVCVGAS